MKPTPNWDEPMWISAFVVLVLILCGIAVVAFAVIVRLVTVIWP